jgi:hypothetical protein
MATPSTIRIELVWKLTAVDFAVNVLHYTTGVGGPLLADDVDQMGSAIGTAFTASNLITDYSNEMALDRIRVRDMRTDGNGVFEDSVNVAGSGSSNTCPAQTCVVTTLRTSVGSRRGRGRIFWPAPNVNSVADAGVLSPVSQARFALFVQDLLLINGGSQGNVVLGVFSRTDNSTRSVISHNTDRIFDVQTRRRDLSI